MANLSGVGAFGAYTLTVTPEALHSGADGITANVNKLRDAFDKITNTARNTASYWQGEAGDAHRELFELIKPVMEEILARYSEHAGDLHDIASTYSGAEDSIVKEVESLPPSPLS